MRALALALLLIPALAAAEPAKKAPFSAFRFRDDPDVRREVPLERILEGIPVPDPRDRIRSIDAPGEAARAFVDGEEVPPLRAYWFAWFAFHPRTTVYEPPPPAKD